MGTILNILAKFLDVDTICKIMARLIARVLEKASKKGGKAWDVSKTVIEKTGKWCNLFTEVYEDDNMTPEEEALVAEAIRNQTDIEKVVDIIKSKAGTVEEEKEEPKKEQAE
jgi:hypothetical protein